MAGQISGLVKGAAPAREIVENLMAQGEHLLRNLLTERGITIE